MTTVGDLQGGIETAERLLGSKVVLATARLIREDGRSRCAISDDGTGLDVVHRPAGLDGRNGRGLDGMQERLGSLGGSSKISSTPGQGTELNVTLPLEA